MNQKINKLFIAFILALLIHSTQDLSGQVIELNAFTGWQLNGRAKLYDGEFRISDAQNYGGKLSYGTVLQHLRGNILYAVRHGRAILPLWHWLRWG
jgi:hypothetical protein